ncbi:MAG TPA: glycosyltransferase [Chloroflexota bacterium]|nr:glycosyltransferase [Chloroflexota bacterium]
MTAPQLSVVIPTYRRPAALETTLRALAAQQFELPYEVIVCDDGSPETEAEQVRHIVGAQEAYQVRLIRQENAGPAAARNAGAREARSNLLLFLDDDCAPAPNLLQLHWRAHEAADSREGGMAVMGHVAWSPHVRVTPFMELVVRGAQFNYGAIADPERVPFTCFYTANCSLQRADLERAGWFDASLPPFMEDTEFAYRLIRSDTRIVYRPEAVVFHEHAVELSTYLDRQRKAGRAAVEVARRHPELFEIVGVGDVADISLREQFYNALLRYAFVCGVEEGLMDQVHHGTVTGSELRATFEAWTAQWAVRQAAVIRSWRERSEALSAELGRRDTRLAEVTQQKDDRIAELEAQLARFNRILPLRVYHFIKGRLRSGGRAGTVVGKETEHG